MKEAILARIKNGAVIPIFDRYGAAGQFLKKHEGKEVFVESDTGAMKTNKQLGYLFGVVFKIVSEDTGFTIDEVYQVFKQRFARYVKPFRGSSVDFTKGLSDMTKLDAGAFIDKVVHYVRTDMGMIIPDPDPEYNWRDNERTGHKHPSVPRGR